MITLLKKIAIRAMDDPFNIVYLTNIMEGVDGAATFGYSLEPVAIQVEDNQTQQYKHTHTFDVRVIEESSDSATIDAWIAAQKRVQICGQGIDGLFFMDDVLLMRNKQYDQVVASAFTATADTVTSYATGLNTIGNINSPEIVTASWEKQQIFAGSALYDRFQNNIQKSFRTNGTNTYQHGWVDFVGNTSNVNTISNTINIARTDSGIGTTHVYADTYFMPFSDQVLTATLNVVNVDLNGGDPIFFGIIWRGIDATTSNNAGAFRKTSITTTGLKTVSYAGNLFADFTSHRDVQLTIGTRSLGQSIEFDAITLNYAQVIPTGLADQSSEILDGSK